MCVRGLHTKNYLLGFSKKIVDLTIEVIVVDDSVDAVEVLQEFLELKGIDVLAVGYNGKQAVELYHQHNPDVVIIDVTMPYYDGFYALENIRKLDSEVKIVMVSGYEHKTLHKKMFELKADAIAVKPYDIEDIVDVLERVTGKLVSPTSIG